MRHIANFAHALPLDDLLFQEPFYVTHAGREHVTPRQPYPRPGHPSYYGFTWADGRVLGEFCLVLLLSGKGEIETARGMQTVRAGQGFLYQPGEWHRHRPAQSSGWTAMWINFNGSLPHRWMRDETFRLNKNLIEVDDPRLFQGQFRQLVGTIHAASTRNSLLFSWQAIGLVARFLHEVPASTRPFAAEPSTIPLVAAALDFIWSHSHNQIGVDDIAQFVGANRRTLERRFKAATGDTLLHEIHRCRISRAALLLRQTDAPLKYIVGRAGFASHQQQRQTFRRHFGQAPKTFRRDRRVTNLNNPIP
ncbi:MAG: AraC family transcriptional regulator [Nibricoccus sp.]